MRKIVALAISFTLVFTSLFLTSCDVMRLDVKNQVKIDINDTYDVLKKQVGEGKEDTDFLKVVEKYCKDNKIDYKHEGNFVYLEKTKGRNAGDGSTVFLVASDPNKTDETCQSIAIALSMYKNAYSNEKFALIVAPKNKIADIPTKYTKSDQVICIGHSDKGKIINGSTGNKIYRMYKNVEMEQPEGNLAYELEISGIESIDSGNRGKKQINPIVKLTDILSKIRTSGINLEISSFANNGTMEIYPTSANVIVVVDENQRLKFEEWMSSEQSDFNRNKDEKNPNLKFTYKVVKTPEAVLDYDDTESLLGLTYTLVDGVFKTTEDDYKGDILGICTLAKIRITDNQVEIRSYARYIDKETEREMDETFKIISGLSNFKIKKETVQKIWTADENNLVIGKGKLQKALKKYDLKYKVKTTFEENGLTNLIDKNNIVNAICLDTNLDDSVSAVMSLIEYLKDTGM